MTQASFPHTSLLQNLTDSFNDEDLRTLCFDVRVDYDSLPALGKAGKARELILALARRSPPSARGQMPCLAPQRRMASG